MALLAQTTGGPSDITSIATLVTQIGLSAVFLWLWWTERKERQEQQAQLFDVLKQALPALSESTDVLDQVQRALGGLVDQAPSDRRSDLALRRLELLTDELGMALRQTKRRGEETGGP